MKQLFTVFLTFIFMTGATVPSHSGGTSGAEDYAAIKNTYLATPFFSQVTLESWQEPSEIDPDLLVVFAAYQNGGDWFDPSHGFEISDMYNPLVPADLVEGLIQQFFAVDAGHIRRAAAYDSARQSYAIPGMGGASNCTVTGVSRTGSVMEIRYNHWQDALLSGSGTLTVALREDGTFRYTSNLFSLYERAPREAVDDVARSAQYTPETGRLQLTIPAHIPAGYRLYLHVSGRVGMGDAAMSIHPFQQENESGSWTPGAVYTHSIQPDALQELWITVALQKEGSTDLLSMIEIILDGQGGKTYSSELQG